MDDKRSPAHGDSQEKVKAMRMIHGKVEEKATNEHNLLTVDTEAEGTHVMEYVGKDAVLVRETHGGGNMMVVGGEAVAKAAIKAHEELAGENIRVKIVGKDMKKTFDRKFKPTTLLKEIQFALIKQEEVFFRISRDGKELEEDLTLAQAAATGSTINWNAEK